MDTTYTAEEREAYQLGKNAAEAAASWTTDGNMDVEAAKRTLAMLRDGDPEAYDRLPRYPDLSGEWADDPTPTRLARELGVDVDHIDHPNDDVVDALADAWEAGVSDHFEAACERELITFTS